MTFGEKVKQLLSISSDWSRGNEIVDFTLRKVLEEIDSMPIRYGLGCFEMFISKDELKSRLTKEECDEQF